MDPPLPTPILRLVHVDNVEVFLRRRSLHAPDHYPEDGLRYRPIHDEDVLAKRRHRRLSCGPGGTIRDYVSFYFGPLSPMLLRLRSGQVLGYGEGQRPLVHLVTDAQTIAAARLGFVFSDGHSLSASTRWFDDLVSLQRIDWSIVGERYWADTTSDPDRQRRKQAEFLVYRSVPWGLIAEIAVIGEETRGHLRQVLARYPATHHPRISVRREWYY